jgi:hypothetical protein
VAVRVAVQVLAVQVAAEEVLVAAAVLPDRALAAE